MPSSAAVAALNSRILPFRRLFVVIVSKKSSSSSSSIARSFGFRLNLWPAADSVQFSRCLCSSRPPLDPFGPGNPDGKFIFPNQSAKDLEQHQHHHQQQEAEKKLHFDRNFITAQRAMRDFLLNPEHLKGLRSTTRRSPIESEPPLQVYWRKDVEAKSIQVWGSLVKLEAAIEARDLEEEMKAKELLSFYQRFIRSRKKKKQQQQKLRRENWPVRRLSRVTQEQGLSGQSGKVVLTAIGINLANFVGKLVAWLLTGSHALFSEAIHSLADTCNQMILAYGIKKSTERATVNHPYGYSNMQYVSSLISGTGIFCVGAGVSIYHGISGLITTTELSSITLAMVVLSASFLSESVTLVLAIKSIRESATIENMSFIEYVMGGYDPSVNVVLLEDIAAVTGVVIAGSAMGLSVYTSSHIPDAVGSIFIGCLLGTVASFMIYTNTQALVGRSIPSDKLRVINKMLEGDLMVRQVHDVKGIDMGNGIIRYKAELDIDGRELTRYYLKSRDLNDLLAEVQSCKNPDEFETFMLKHGENIVDCLGEQVDRIEHEIRKTHPEIRHMDLEVL